MPLVPSVMEVLGSEEEVKDSTVFAEPRIDVELFWADSALASMARNIYSGC